MAMTNRKRIGVVASGPRGYYGVARALNSANALSKLYTGLSLNAGVGRALRPFTRMWRGRHAATLSRRNLLDIEPEKIVSFPIVDLWCRYGLSRCRTEADRNRCFVEYGRLFCRHVVRKFDWSATAIYAFNTTALEVFTAPNARRVQKILEQTIAPLGFAQPLMVEEANLWPSWQINEDEGEWGRRLRERETDEMEAADYIVCGSQFVADKVKENTRVSARIEVVPYGFEFCEQAIGVRRPPHRGLHVLFCGAVCLRKGIQYLNQAICALGSVDIDVAVVGAVQLSEYGIGELHKSIRLVGPVPNAELSKFYTWADVFVLPTVCDGSATVLFEAAAAGLPVITTPNAGSVIRHNSEGLIVPIRNAEALASALEFLLRRPDARLEMGERAIVLSRDYGLSNYRTKLMNVLLGDYATNC